MKKKTIVVGSAIAVVILILASFPLVVGYQTTQSTLPSKAKVTLAERIDNTKFNRFEDLFINRIQKNDIFKDITVHEMMSALHHIQHKRESSDDGYLLSLIIGIIEYIVGVTYGLSLIFMDIAHEYMSNFVDGHWFVWARHIINYFIGVFLGLFLVLFGWNVYY